MSAISPDLRDAFSFYKPSPRARMELYETLSEYFKGASTRDGLILLSSTRSLSENDFFLGVRFSGDRLVEVRKGVQFTDAVFADLRRYLAAEFLDPRPDLVGNYVLYAGRRVAGCWRYRDKFQLCPHGEVPAGLQTAVYRCRLELAHRGSGSYILNARRTYEKFREIFPLLSFFSEGNIWWPGHAGLRSYHWVRIPRSWGEGLPREAPLPVGTLTLDQYGKPGFSENPAGRQIARTDKNILPGRWGLDQPDELTLPEDIETYFDRYFVLSEDIRRQFVRACYWMQQSYEVANISESASYQAVIQAVEALAHDPMAWKASPPLRGKAPGPTRKFREFLRRHVDLRGIEEKEIDGFYDSLYSVRSDIAHGKVLQHSDEHAYDWFGGHELRVTKRTMINIARAAILSWLEDSAAEHLR